MTIQRLNDRFHTHTHIYIYIYTHIGSVLVAFLGKQVCSNGPILLMIFKECMTHMTWDGSALQPLFEVAQPHVVTAFPDHCASQFSCETADFCGTFQAIPMSKAAEVTEDRFLWEVSCFILVPCLNYTELLYESL